MANLNLTVGTRMYNRGDVANPDHYGVIIEVKTDKWGTDYRIQPDADSARTEPYWVSAFVVSETDLGHSGTRIVTEAANKAYRARTLRQMRERFEARNAA